MYRTMFWTALVAVSLISSTACKQKGSDGDHVADVKSDLARARADFQAAVNERIVKLDAKIDELERKGDAKSKEVAANIRVRRDAAKAKLSTMAERTEANWDAFKLDVSNGWDQLDKDVTEALK